MRDVEVIEAPRAAVVALDPFRARLLAELAEPASGSQLAARLGVPRQRVSYHLRALEHHGLVTTVEERPRRGLMERMVQASARSYVVSPAALDVAASDPNRTRDRLSASYLVAVAARTVHEVGALLRRAEAAGKRLPTLAIDLDVRFASAADRAAFADELAEAVARLAARHHDETAPRGRWHRITVTAHPRPQEEMP